MLLPNFAAGDRRNVSGINNLKWPEGTGDYQSRYKVFKYFRDLKGE